MTKQMKITLKLTAITLAAYCCSQAPVAAQTAAFNQGLRDGYSGGMSPGAVPGWSYANGRQQGQEQRFHDDNRQEPGAAWLYGAGNK